MANIVFSEAPGLNDSIFGKSQAPIRAFLESRVEAFEQKSIAQKIFKHSKSSNWAEKIGSMTSMRGPLPVGENGPYPTDGYQEGYSKTIEHMVWKDRFDISREMVDDAKGGIVNFKSRPQAFVKGYNRTMEMFAASLVGHAMNGASSFTMNGKTFDTTSADGACMFSTVHSSIVDSTYLQSNLFTNPLDATNINLVETAMQNFCDDNGNLVDVAPDTILIPNDAAIKAAVLVACGSDQVPGSGNNDWNFQVGRWNILVWPYLNRFVTGSNTPWIMFDSSYNEDNECAVWLDRVSLEVTSGIDRDTDANYWSLYARFGAGFADWRGFSVGGMTGGTTLQ